MAWPSGLFFLLLTDSRVLILSRHYPIEIITVEILNRLIPDFYVITDVSMHSEIKVDEEDFRTRARLHFGLDEDQLELALNGKKVNTSQYIIQPSFFESYTS